MTQNHRMAEVGMVLWVHLAQSPLQQGHPEQCTQHHVYMAFGDLLVGYSIISLGNL